ncbi:uncharacterized protein BT62DRAFT_1012030 [Guyanagaster necrorhizus]|uniref:F-box domain-containing protein n=1 Tax=Guyanagaster necrorhizus TaxID=856835 RepID=A0A9P8AM83_9AGAR|nr:uncharacterized protein BT62DRAFT_1012030 [Guyanagaster necrorhizus MCA 3950]KAG7441003.1 hypothetical protein BT62DRAFT_1012030 [Guyanagaster necrorhizus MCA 3950]
MNAQYPVKPQLEIVTCARRGTEFKVELWPENTVVPSLDFNFHLVTFIADSYTGTFFPRTPRLTSILLKAKVSPTAITALPPRFINDLPVELLHEIFLWAIQDDSAIAARVIQSLWTLSYVYHQWRHIATSFPYLWSTVHVGSTRQSLRHSFSISNIEGLSTVLRWSGTTALMRRVEFTDHELAGSYTHVRDLLKTRVSDRVAGNP